MKKIMFTGIACLLFAGLGFSASGNNHLASLVNKERALADTNFQPLENQRLSTTNSPTFAGDTIKNTTPTLVLQTSADSQTARIYRNTTSNTLKISNNVVQAGGIGKAIQLTANNQYVSFTQALATSPAVFTVSFWIKLTGSAPTGTNTRKVFRLGSRFSGAILAGDMLSSGTIRVGYSTGAGSVSGSANYYDGNWHNIVVTQNSSGVTSLYADNTFQSSATLNITLTSTNFAVIGTDSAAITNSVLGVIDQFMVYNTVLSTGNMATIYNSGNGTFNVPLTGNLINRYEFEEGTGTTTADLSGHGVTATLNNGASWTTGITPIQGTTSEATVITSQDGVFNTEKGQHTFGDFNGGSVIQGKAIRFLQNNIYPLWSDDSGRISIDNTNTGTYPTLSNNFAVKGSSYFNGNVDVNGLGQFSSIRVKSTYGNSDLVLQSIDSVRWDLSSNQAVNGGSFGIYQISTALTRFLVDSTGNVGIGTSTPSDKLSVNGNIRAKQLTIAQTGWPDYVFDTAYKLPELTRVSQYIRDNKHLPGVPSAKEVLDSGLNVGNNQAALLQKIEELTLYVIAQEKKQQQQDQKQERQEQLIDTQNKLIQQQQELLLKMQAQLNKLQQSTK